MSIGTFGRNDRKELTALPTKGIRPFTFFERGVVGHVGFADPFDEKIAQVSLAC